MLKMTRLPAGYLSQIDLCAVFFSRQMRAEVASPFCYYHIFQGVPVNAPYDRFGNTDSIDLSLRLTQRAQRPAGNHLETANESVVLLLLLLRRESPH